MITIVIYGPQAVGKSALAKWLAEQLKSNPPPHVRRSELFALLSSQGEPVAPGSIEVESTGFVGVAHAKPPSCNCGAVLVCDCGVAPSRPRNTREDCRYRGCMGCEGCR